MKYDAKNKINAKPGEADSLIKCVCVRQRGWGGLSRKTTADFRWESLQPVVLSFSVPFKVVIELNLEYPPSRKTTLICSCVLCVGN